MSENMTPPNVNLTEMSTLEYLEERLNEWADGDEDAMRFIPIPAAHLASLLAVVEYAMNQKWEALDEVIRSLTRIKS